MSSWKKTDADASVDINVLTGLNTTANSANRTALFGNTTADAFVTGQTVGVFAIDSNEQAASGGKSAHAGWVMRRVGSGGRSGRVQLEVLSAMGSISSDAEDTIFADTSITITTQPVNSSANTGSAVEFAVVAVATPAASLTYQWQVDTGGGYANVSDAGVYSGSSTNTLSISDNTGLNTYTYRVNISATGATNVTSNEVTLTEV